ncbi:hypothetical protein [Siphonobacter curvatus]|uniref:Uncharacterized protein n=1 Tax=Siphonobacter curvatus TaxID=2094562 RepID=A0A2S7IFJ5_9BACT|nr:hypothetical protein [Siphonobacter curvatus]PQA54084.1 hypothetical protein C5O19_23235 [Siphonobacter curvatus]
MFRPFLLSVILLLNTGYVFAQSTFQKGYIVKAAGDTLACYIHYQDWSDSPAEIRIKRDLTQKEEIISAVSYKAFYIAKENQLYKSYTLNLLYVSEDVYETKPDTYVQQTLFLQQLWSDQKISLYYARSDKDGRIRFFIEEGPSFYELINYSFYRQKEGQNYRVAVQEYKQQLEQLTADVASFSMTPPLYASRYLINYLQAYHDKKYTEEPVKFRLKDEKSTFYVGLNAGLERLNISDLSQGKNQASLGLSARVNFPRNHQQMYAKIAFHRASKIVVLQEETRRPVDSHLKTIEILAGQYLGGGKIQPFYNVGLVIFSNKIATTGILTPGIGVSFKKRLELEVSHFSRLFFKMGQEEAPFLIPPRISLNYYIKLNGPNKLF